MIPHTTVSGFNNKYTSLPERQRVHLSDCTLREGEQSAIVNFTPSQKLRLAHRLAEAGIAQIQVGYPGLSETDAATMSELRKAEIGCDLEAVVLSYLDSWKEQIEASAASQATVVNIVHVPSPPRRERVFKVSPEQILERTDQAVRAAKELGLFVTYCPADTTRTELELSLQLIRAAGDAGADRISIADTLGAATPGAVRFLVEQVREVTDLPLAFHCHNDFGLATANALAAIEAGAEMIDTTLNGWGDRTGNPPTEEFAAVLQILYGTDYGLDVVALATLSKDVAAELGTSVPLAKPITGEIAFAHKLETHVKAVLGHPPAFESFDPALVGGARQVALGQYSGPEAVRSRLLTLGIEPDERTLQELAFRVQSTARETNRVLNDNDLREIAEQVTQG